MGGSCDLNGISIPLSSMWYSMQYHFFMDAFSKHKPYSVIISSCITVPNITVWLWAEPFISSLLIVIVMVLNAAINHQCWLRWWFCPYTFYVSLCVAWTALFPLRHIAKLHSLNFPWTNSQWRYDGIVSFLFITVYSSLFRIGHWMTSTVCHFPRSVANSWTELIKLIQ